jgi:hypothetical protein
MAMRHDPSLEFLPDWLPDETLFSLASRYHRLTGHVAGRHTSKILFGSARSGYQHDFPSGIDHFVQVTDGNYGQSNRIIRSRTLLPYYLAFKNRRVARDAVAAMRSQRIGHLKYRLGILTSGARAHHPLRMCNDCMNEDQSNVGVGYWHLSHQFPGVLVCSKHKQALRVSGLKSTGVKRFGFFLPDDTDACLIDVCVQADSRVSALLQSIAAISGHASRVGRTGHLRLDTFRKTCDIEFLRRGYLSDNGRIRQKMASTDFAQFVAPIARLSEFEAIPREPRTISYMLTRLHSQSADPPHPMRLIAVIAWLFGSFERYATTAKKLATSEEIGGVDDSSPSMGVDSNNKQRDFLELISSGEAVSRAAIRIGVDPAVGIGWAESAGVPVTRRLKRIRGTLLVDIQHRLRLGQTKQDIAEEVGVSVSSVSRVLYSDPGLAGEWKESRDSLRREATRTTWNRLILSHGHLGTRILRSMEPAVYAWLYRNDRYWLEMQRQKIATSPPRPAIRVDWLKRDNELEGELREAIDLLVMSGELKQVSLGRLCQLVPDLKRRLGQSDRLPRTKQLLNQILKRGGPKDSGDSLPLT